MANRVYHWKHGWIPLDHEAALSKAHGSHAGAARLLSPVSQTDLPRASHIIAAHSRGSFIVHDSKSGHTAKLPEHEAERLQREGHKIQGVKSDGAVHTTGGPAASSSSWDKTTFEHDGSKAGKAAAARIKQSHKQGNVIVHIETDMTPEQTKSLLADVSEVRALAGTSTPVTVLVPAADKKFQGLEGFATGGYTYYGSSTIYLNPMCADGSIDTQAGMKRAAEKSSMPALADTSLRRYTIAHEWGHLYDGGHNHTHTPSGETKPSSVTNAPSSGNDGLSRYGQTNAAEGYAEAWAQWLLGGPGSNAAADAYAKEFGWPKP